jgi:hypothetical protein
MIRTRYGVLHFACSSANRGESAPSKAMSIGILARAPTMRTKAAHRAGDSMVTYPSHVAPMRPTNHGDAEVGFRHPKIRQKGLAFQAARSD